MGGNAGRTTEPFSSRKRDCCPSAEFRGAHSRARGARTGCPLLPRASTSSYHALDGGGARRRRRRGYVSERRSRLAVPHSRSSTQSAGRADSSSSARFADRPPAPPSGDSSPPSRRGPGLASGSAPETPRRLAPVPGVPGDGDVASGDPPQVSQSPREEGTPREERGGARRRGSQHGCREEDETTQVQGEKESARSRERGAGDARRDGGARRRRIREGKGGRSGVRKVGDGGALRRRRGASVAIRRRAGRKRDAAETTDVSRKGVSREVAFRADRDPAGVGRSPLQSPRGGVGAAGEARFRFRFRTETRERRPSRWSPFVPAGDAAARRGDDVRLRVCVGVRARAREADDARTRSTGLAASRDHRPGLGLTRGASGDFSARRGEEARRDERRDEESICRAFDSERLRRRVRGAEGSDAETRGGKGGEGGRRRRGTRRGARARPLGEKKSRGIVRTPFSRAGDVRGDAFRPTEIGDVRVFFFVCLRAPARAGVPRAPRPILGRAAVEAKARGRASADDGVRRAVSAQRRGRKNKIFTRVRAV